MGFLNGASTSEHCFVLPLNGSKHCLLYTFKAIYILGILDPGTSLDNTLCTTPHPVFPLHTKFDMHSLVHIIEYFNGVLNECLTPKWLYTRQQCKATLPLQRWSGQEATDASECITMHCIGSNQIKSCNHVMGNSFKSSVALCIKSKKYVGFQQMLVLSTN